MLGREGPAPAGRRATPSGPVRRDPGGWTGRVGIFGRWSLRPGSGVCGAPGIVTGRLCCLEGVCPPGRTGGEGMGSAGPAGGRVGAWTDCSGPLGTAAVGGLATVGVGMDGTTPPTVTPANFGRPGTRSTSGRATSGPVGRTRGMSGFSKSLATRSVARAAPSGFGFAICWGVSAAATAAGAGVGGGSGGLTGGACTGGESGLRTGGRKAPPGGRPAPLRPPTGIIGRTNAESARVFRRVEALAGVLARLRTGNSSSDCCGSGFSFWRPLNRSRTLSAVALSNELEWDLTSSIPNSGSTAMISPDLTSSSRASSLMRIVVLLSSEPRVRAP